MLNRHTPSKKPKSNKGLFRLSIAFLLALFGFNTLLIFLPEKVFAAPTIEEEYKVWRSYTLIANCLAQDYTKGIEKDEQIIVDSIFETGGMLEINSTKPFEKSGKLYNKLVDLDSDVYNCNTLEDVKPALKQLGFDNVFKFEEWLGERLDAVGGSRLNKDQIRDKLQGRVTNMGVRLNLKDKADFQYWYWNSVYRASTGDGGCGGILSNGPKVGMTNVTLEKDPFWYADSKDTSKPKSYSYANFKPGKGDEVEGLDELLRGGGAQSCTDIAKKLTKDAAQAYLNAIAANPDEETSAINSSSGAAEAEEDGCESNGGVLGWLMCPVVKLLDGTVGFLDQKIRDMLYVKSDSYFGSDSDLMTTWKNIRNIAYLILIPIMLVMVIGTALGFEVFSAYTVKKALPRMVIAVIFIALSWYVCVFMVNFTNVLGAGAKGLVTAPLKEEKGTESGDPPILSAMKNAGIVADSGTGDDGTNGGNIAVLGAGTLVAGGALFATGMISIGIIMSTFATAALILGAIFLLLVFRQMLVIGLVLVAPLAILSWIFPGNDKLWKLWWGSFSKLLLIFPLIMLLAGVGEAFAMITGTAAAQDDGIGGGQLVALIIIIAAYIMPFLFIPFAFKWAGGVFGNLAGMVNDKNRGALDRLKKGRGNMRAKHMNDAKNFGRFKGRNALTRGLNNIGGIGTNRPGAWMSPNRLRGSRAAGQAAKAAEDLKNDKVFQANQNDDKFLLALGNEKLARKKLSQATTPGERAAWEGALANARAVSSRGSQGTTLAALDAHAATGYNYSSGQTGYNELAETYIEALGIDESHVRRDEHNNVIGVTGPQAAAYASHMNTAQFSLKKAGRVDLGGINNAEGEDARSAIRKFSNYSRSQQKTETYHGGAEAWLGSGTVDGQTGKTLGTSHEMARAIEASMADGSTDANALLEYHSMLAGDYGSATEANKVEIQKQMEAIEQATANIGAQAEDRLQGSTGPLPGSAERLIGVDLGSRGRQARQQRGSTPEAERQPEE